MTDSEYHLQQLEQWGTDGGRVPDVPEDETQGEDLPENSVLGVAHRDVDCPS